ncbi:class I SAM-dependent methyltransferase [Bacillus sp. Marseille-P3661]|uniref:class I SAM-dependent methyltransferase n=1 Tax=Bacillus sp. Marseille-P3661 TaxID=1936234 RepID=UPI000C816FFF|nr:class I SAM-dependent methyltransferase [Bacillus sp. Marseille-P3661]
MRSFTYLDFLAYMGVGNAHPGGLELTKKIVKASRLRKDDHILDVGCGTGLTAAYLVSEYGCQVTAIDIHPEMVKKAQRRFKEANLPIILKRANAENLPFPDQTFDVVITESVTAFTDIYRSLKEYQRVLKDGGTLLALEMTAEDVLNNEDKQSIQNLYGMNQILTEQQWMVAIEQAGFNPIEILFSGKASEHLVYQNELLETSMPIFEPSEQVDTDIYNIWADHELLILKYQSVLGHRVFKAIK